MGSWLEIGQLEDCEEDVINKGFEAPLKVFEEAAGKAASAIGAMTEDQFVPDFCDTYVKCAGKFNKKMLEGAGVSAEQIAEFMPAYIVAGSKKHEEGFKMAADGGESVTVESLKKALMLYQVEGKAGSAYSEAGGSWPLH